MLSACAQNEDNVNFSGYIARLLGGRQSMRGGKEGGWGEYFIWQLWGDVVGTIFGGALGMIQHQGWNLTHLQAKHLLSPLSLPQILYLTP